MADPTPPFAPVDDWDQLARSVPTVPDNWGSRFEAAHEWFTNNVQKPARRALMYPERVIARHMDPTGRDPFYNPQSTPYRLEQGRGMFETVGKFGGYPEKEGDRLSTNVEDRIPRSKWTY